MFLFLVSSVQKEVVMLVSAIVIGVALIIAAAFLIKYLLSSHAPNLFARAPLLSVTVPLLVCAGVVVALLIAVISYGHRQEEREHRLNLTAETQAVVTESAYHKDTNNTVVRYGYAVGGRSYSGVGVLEGDVHQAFRLRLPARICYNPAEPSDSLPAIGDVPCGKPGV